MADDVRIEALPFGDVYFAVIRRSGQPDEIMDGDDGRPRKFATAYDAAAFAKRMLFPPPFEEATAAWRRDRDLALQDERARVFAAGPAAAPNVAIEYRRARR